MQMCILFFLASTIFAFTCSIRTCQKCELIFQTADLSSLNNPGEKKARDEAAVKLVKNHEAVVKFACRGAGAVGVKRFQAPLADPYAIANLNFKEDVDCLLRYTVHALLDGYENVSLLESTGGDEKSRSELKNCVRYLQERIGVPRDMSYPAARQLRAHLGYVMDKI